VARWTCRAFLEFVRDTPLLVHLLFGYFVIFAPLLSRPLAESGFDDKILIGILLLSVFEGAYLGEILRGGVESIPATQWDAARAVGFGRFQIYRYVTFLEALRRVLPAMAGLFVSLIKDSSLLNVIGVSEYFYNTKNFISRSYAGLEGVHSLQRSATSFSLCRWPGCPTGSNDDSAMKLEIRDAAKRYGSTQVLDSLSLTIGSAGSSFSSDPRAAGRAHCCGR